MPELPEVEVVADGLTSLLGQCVLSVAISGKTLRGNLYYDQSNGGLTEIVGQQLVEVGRRGRYLVLRFSAGKVCLVHLGMTGSFLIVPVAQDVSYLKHIHIRINFTNYQLLYCDPRRFGGWALAHDPVIKHSWLARLGVEPLSVEQLIKIHPKVTHYATDPLCAEYLMAFGQRKPQMFLKRLLMDNSILTGVGNIYATEILFAAGWHPEQPIGTLTLKDWQRMVFLIQDFLLQGIKYGGCSIRDYMHSDGGVGHFQDQLLVYGRFKQDCPKCHTPLAKVIIDGRSSVYCSQCQPMR